MLRSTVLALVVALAAAGFGQSLPSAPHLTLEQRGAFLLAEPSLRSSLGVASATTAKISAAMASYAKQQDKLYRAKDPDDVALRKLDEATATSLLSALQPAQRKRLFQVALKRAGASALLASDVIDALGITSPQRKRIEATLEAAGEPEQRLEQAIAARTEKASDDAERVRIQSQYATERKRLAALREKAEAKAFEVLTPAQRKKLAALRA
jgi:hypothetical protein